MKRLFPLGLVLWATAVLVACWEGAPPSPAPEPTLQMAEFTLPYPLHGVPLVTDGIRLFVVGGSDVVGTVSNRGDLFVMEPED